MRTELSRRAALAAGVTASLPLFVPDVWAQAVAGADEVDLVDDAPLGEMGLFDANYFGPAATKAVRGPFVFPADVDADGAYGIDVSHHTKAVPWAALKAAKVNYVYIKAGQGARNRDPMLEQHWAAATAAGVPCGAYHFLSAGVPGKDQGAYFLKRLRDVGGLKRGHLQPVIDLEWDFLGRDFKRQLVSQTVRNGQVVKTYKDHWSDHSADAIAAELNACLAVVTAGLAPLGVRPIIYTNLSWWQARLKPATRFQNVTVWPSDYRQRSYTDGVPRAVPGHPWHLWQFSEKGSIVAGGKRYGPFDCNKLVKGGMADLLIA